MRRFLLSLDTIKILCLLLLSLFKFPVEEIFLGNKRPDTRDSKLLTNATSALIHTKFQIKTVL